MVKINVIGEPATQGSKRAFGTKGGKTILVEQSSKQLKPWRDSVAWGAREAAMQHGKILGAVAVQIVFTVQKPKSPPKGHTKGDPWVPTSRGDIDKLARAVNDALVTGGIIEDDRKIYSLTCLKSFPGEYPDTLEVPGACIRIWTARELMKELEEKLKR